MRVMGCAQAAAVAFALLLGIVAVPPGVIGSRDAAEGTALVSLATDEARTGKHQSEALNAAASSSAVKRERLHPTLQPALSWDYQIHRRYSPYSSHGGGRRRRFQSSDETEEQLLQRQYQLQQQVPRSRCCSSPAAFLPLLRFDHRQGRGAGCRRRSACSIGWRPGRSSGCRSSGALLASLGSIRGSYRYLPARMLRYGDGDAGEKEEEDISAALSPPLLLVNDRCVSARVVARPSHRMSREAGSRLMMTTTTMSSRFRDRYRDDHSDWSGCADLGSCERTTTRTRRLTRLHNRARKPHYAEDIKATMIEGIDIQRELDNVKRKMGVTVEVLQEKFDKFKVGKAE
eukprot:GHVU01008892.1.p1 GENE.GHVU01008892.1~~GHVU01008892.1.p1  ORF type:complete len:345 (+),score=57.08 GHVU01008892.1:602-1636(+)